MSSAQSAATKAALEAANARCEAANEAYNKFVAGMVSGKSCGEDNGTSGQGNSNCNSGQSDSCSSDSAAQGGCNSVAGALSKLKWFNGKPNTKAQYYIYLQSASWCGPCRAEMPEIVRAYKAMKKDGRVELVLLGGDKDEKSAKAYLKKYGAKFPGTMRKDEGVSCLPGACKLPCYYPAAVIVRANGEVIESGHGSIIRDWKKYTIGACQK